MLMLREWYMHPKGQLPAYEWELSDINPPIHAGAAWRVYEYFHGDTGAGLGASHQTGWTGLIAKILQQSASPPGGQGDGPAFRSRSTGQSQARKARLGFGRSASTRAGRPMFCKKRMVSVSACDTTSRGRFRSLRR